MTRTLFFSAITKFLLGVVCVAAPIFLPAGTLHYPKAWLLMALVFLPMLPVELVLMVVDPALLQRRLQSGERQEAQKQVVRQSGLMFLCGFVAAGLDHRFGWSRLPGWVTPCAAAVFLLGYALYAEVLRENTWLSRTVRVHKGQSVIDTGLYSLVRHPMYCATVILFLAMPLVLGSLVSLAIFLTYPFLIAKRIRHEEQVLEAELEGYTVYKNRVRYRLIPYIW